MAFKTGTNTLTSTNLSKSRLFQLFKIIPIILRLKGKLLEMEMQKRSVAKISVSKALTQHVFSKSRQYTVLNCILLNKYEIFY